MNRRGVQTHLEFSDQYNSLRFSYYVHEMLSLFNIPYEVLSAMLHTFFRQQLEQEAPRSWLPRAPRQS
jgi:hypothetical protein